MPESNAHLLKRWFEEVWNQSREASIDELAAPNMVAHGLLDANGQPIDRIDKFKVFWRQFRDAFPDLHIEVNEALADGDKQVVRCTVRATHTGGGLGFAATNKPITFTGTVIARIQDGRMVEAWDNWDFLGLYQQLGVTPAAAV